MVDTRDLKSRGHYVRAGSSPARGTIIAVLKMKTIQGSYIEYLGLPETRIEYIKGIIKYMSPTPSIKHQDLIGNLYLKIRNFFASFNEKKYKIIFAPVEVCLFEGSYDKEKVEAALQPDLIIVFDSQS